MLIGVRFVVSYGRSAYQRHNARSASLRGGLCGVFLALRRGLNIVDTAINELRLINES